MVLDRPGARVEDNVMFVSEESEAKYKSRDGAGFWPISVVHPLPVVSS